MISGVKALLLLVALTGCCLGSYDLDDESLGSPNITLAPIRHKVFSFPPQQATSLDSLNYLNYEPHNQPIVVGPPCSSGDTLQVPAGSSVTFTSPTPPNQARRVTKQCGWQFKTVPGSTFTLSCQSFSLSGRDTFYVYEYRTSRPTIYRFRSQSFPSGMLLNALKVKVWYLYGESQKKGYFSCTITASGGTTSTTNSSSSASIPPTSSELRSLSTATSSTTSTNTSMARIAPHSTSKRCRCGIVNRRGRIVGGTNTEVNEYPWQVGLIEKQTRSVFCGGSLISDQYIVTAAHCMKGHNRNSFRLLLGGHTRKSPSAKERIVLPIEIKTHPKYNEKTDNNDISLIKIARLNFNDPNLVVRPVCLPNSNANYVGVQATTTGWGTLYEDPYVQPNILQEVNIPIVTNTFCKSVYGSAITNSMICAGTAAGGKDSCQSDSGGPLIAPDGANYELIGVVSFGWGCGRPGIPGVYARITTLKSWIGSSAAGSTTCGR